MALLPLSGCSSDPGTASSTGGSPSTGGQHESGGSGGGSGGSAGSGGTQSSGGTTASGGTTTTGGTTASGGTTTTGGSTASGGETGSGGSSSSGGTTGSGGRGTRGGSTGDGGQVGTGGVAAKGGSSGTGGVSGTGGTTGSGSPKAHVFLLLGQSNMAGYAKAQASDKENTPRIRVIGFDDCSATGRKKDQWADAAPPLHECWNSAVGPGDSFSKTLLEKLPPEDTILLVPCALSGQSMNVMKKGTSNYTWFISRAKSAQQLGGEIEGLLFHQGESDCGQSSWPNAVKQFVTDLRADLSLGDSVPFLAGELPPDSACQHNTLVNQLPNIITNAYVVSSQGLKLDPADTQWRMHFGHDDTVELGKRYAAKLIEVLKM